MMSDQMCYIFICRPSLLFFHQKKSRKFRICSFRIHHRTPKLLCLHYSCLRKFEGWCWLWFKPFRSCTYLSFLFVLFTRSYIQLWNYKSDLSFETKVCTILVWYYIEGANQEYESGFVYKRRIARLDWNYKEWYQTKLA